MPTLKTSTININRLKDILGEYTQLSLDPEYTGSGVKIINTVDGNNLGIPSNATLTEVGLRSICNDLSLPLHKLELLKSELICAQNKDRQTILELLDLDQLDKNFVEISKRLVSRKIKLGKYLKHQ